MKQKKQLATDKDQRSIRAAASPVAVAEPAHGYIMTRLETGKPGDRYEVEAERTADMIMQSGDNYSAPGFHGEEAHQKPATPWIQQISSRPAMQTSSGGATPSGSWLETQLSQSKGSGTPLPEKPRSFMESRFGAEFGNVNIHTGAQATMLSQSINAQAFTHGNDIYFNQGKYNPKSSGGKHLLAHELTHVVQQGEANATQTFIQKFEQQSFDIRLNVPLIRQERSMSCWHAAARMLWAYRNKQSIHPLPDVYDANVGLQISEISSLASSLGLFAVPSIPDFFTTSDIASLLHNYGPLWAAGNWYGAPHAIVVTGINSNGELFVNDPGTGLQQHDILWFNNRLYFNLDIPMMWLP